MKIKTWLYRRGLGWGPFYSPSAAFIWHKGTIFHPGENLWNNIQIYTPNEIRKMLED